jgi:arylsulfatase
MRINMPTMDRLAVKGLTCSQWHTTALCGEGLCIGYDSADPVSSMYTSGFAFAGGRITKVVFDVADDASVDVAAHLAAAMARD